MSDVIKTCIFIGISLVAVTAMFFIPPIPQDPLYHQFADNNSFLSIPNTLNVLTNLFFAGMAAYGRDIWFLVATIGADNLAAGFTGTIFIAYLSSLTNVSYTATQYALFSSLMTLPGKLISGFSGQIVEAIDWFSFFVYASAMGIPGILLAVIVARRHERSGSPAVVHE